MVRRLDFYLAIDFTFRNRHSVVLALVTVLFERKLRKLELDIVTVGRADIPNARLVRVVLIRKPGRLEVSVYPAERASACF